MIKVIGAVFKYTMLVLTILILSHIIQIRGVSISDHVLNAMNAIGSFSPTHEVQKMARTLQKEAAHLKAVEKAAESEASPDDEHALNDLIEKSRKQK